VLCTEKCRSRADPATASTKPISAAVVDATAPDLHELARRRDRPGLQALLRSPTLALLLSRLRIDPITPPPYAERL